MKKLLLTFLFFTIYVLHAKDFCVIVHPSTSIKTLSTEKIRKIFLKKYHFIDNMKAIPVNLLSNHKLRLLFEKQIIKVKREQLNQYWVQQHFLGVSPPVTQASDQSIKLFIQNLPGAIGYIPKSLVDAKVKVVHEF